MHTSHGAHMQASRPPYVYVVCQELLMDMPFVQAKSISIKINHFTFWHPKYENCKPECAEKDSDCHAQQEQGQLQ